MAGKMDDAREASARRDALRQPTVDALDADLRRPPMPRPIRGWRNRPTCPQCPADSLSSLSWDGHRGLWVHTWCGFTATPEELADLQAVDGAD